MTKSHCNGFLVFVQNVKITEPLMNSLQNRITSFEATQINYQPSDLAKCGFYNNKDGITQCFCCGVKIITLMSETNLWMEHSISSPHCIYVLLCYQANQTYDMFGNQNMTNYNLREKLDSITDSSNLTSSGK